MQSVAEPQMSPAATIVGSDPPVEQAAVVAVSALLCPETFPAASFAWTVNE